ncbi:MAG: cupin domain-containing protein [Chloroflexota bacterium]|nr:cupin domain-containing protein [Chloroflexota bacterium]
MDSVQTQDGIRVVRAADATDKTGQSTGLIRRMGVGGPTGATRIWMGVTVGPPGMDSGPHHHGEAETAGYIVRGHCRVLWGENYEQYVDVGPGDFLFIPPFLPHVEQNRSDEPVELIIARSPDNIVVNLD